MMDPAMGTTMYRRVRWERADADLPDLKAMNMDIVDEVIEVVMARKRSKIIKGFSPIIMFIKP